ncbi:MAG: hypothetical protein WCI29_06710 [Actinomycetes bacterium]
MRMETVLEPEALVGTDTDFRAASLRVLEYLRSHVPMGFWSITRIENERQTYLVLGENDYGLPEGGSHPWDNSLCIRMVAGLGPRIAPVAGAVPAYAGAAVREAVPIGAYSGSPILDVDGSVFGVICGISPRPYEGPGPEAQPLIDLLSGLLTSVVRGERVRAEMERAQLMSFAERDRDPVTGLAQRRTWDMTLSNEQDRFGRLADPTCVLFLQARSVSSSPDDVARRTASVLRAATTVTDVVVRLEDSYGVLLTNADEKRGLQVAESVIDRLTDLEVVGSVGVASWRPAEGPAAAVEEALAQLGADAAVHSRRSG